MESEREEYLPSCNLLPVNVKILDDKFSMFLQCWIDIQAAGFVDTTKEYIIEQTEDDCEQCPLSSCGEGEKNDKTCQECRNFKNKCVSTNRVHKYECKGQTFVGRYFKQQFKFLKTLKIEVKKINDVGDHDGGDVYVVYNNA